MNMLGPISFESWFVNPPFLSKGKIRSTRQWVTNVLV